MGGTPYTSNEIAGKKAVITFTSTTCSTCANQVKFFNELYNDPLYKDVAILIIASGDKKADVERWIKMYGVKPPVYLDENSSMVNVFKPPVKPAAFFIDTQGVIRVVKKAPLTGTNELRNTLDTMQ